MLKQQRGSYLACDAEGRYGDYGPMGELLARAMYDNLNRFIVPNLAGPARLVPLAALVDEDFSLAALRQAAQRGRLDAIQGPTGSGAAPGEPSSSIQRNKGKRRA